MTQNTQDQRRRSRPLHPLVRWRIVSRSQVSDRRETGVFLGKTAFSVFFWIGACLPSDVRYTWGMTGNDTNTKGNEMVAKLQAFADTLDINEATVKEVEGGMFIEFRLHGEDCGRFRYLGLATDGIRKIKAAMKEVEASL